MYKKIIFATLLVLPFVASAQLNRIMNRAKARIDNRIDNKIDREIDKKLDEVEGKEKNSEATPSSKTDNQGNEPAKKETVKGYSRFDFVPGERIIYAEDFAQDAIGELPLTWNSSGKGEVMTLDQYQGKWLRVYENNTYLSGNQKKFGENYTIEFDLMYYFDPKVTGYVLPNWSFGILSSEDMDPTDNKFLSDQVGIANAEVRFAFGSNSGAYFESYTKRRATFNSDRMEVGNMVPNFNKVLHYSIQVQKTRFRLWVNDKKIFDIPRAINTTDTMNQVYFQMEGSNYPADEIGLFVSNIKIATGLPDTRHKLVEEGKFSTTGILFAVNEATIKPESNGVLKEVAEAIKANPGMKVKIIGHTDSDGSDAANLELSKKRAEAVKSALEKDFGIDGAQLQTDGKGETQPMGDNKSKEGKAQNRRVEFIKI